MVEIEKPRIECIDSPEDASYGRYIVEPLERGYGTTLGNSLRRILLSSLPGTAATSIRIAGVQHEFSTIPGVKEDVTEIVLNIKRIIARPAATAVRRPGSMCRMFSPRMQSTPKSIWSPGARRIAPISICRAATIFITHAPAWQQGRPWSWMRR